MSLRGGEPEARGRFRSEGNFLLQTRRFVLRSVGVAERRIGETLRFRPRLIVHLGMVDGRSPVRSRGGFDNPSRLQEQYEVVVGEVALRGSSADAP